MEKLHNVKNNERKRVEAKKRRDKMIEEKRKMLDMSISEKGITKMMVMKTKAEEHAKHEEQIVKVLKKRGEIENQKYWEDSQRIRYKRKYF